ncbi:hypothetical protein ACWT_2678 [Actinoplanes sp. SE50]|uniref:hypothetical protein n=1 Tax=unclassified Actinoplanes TaxID=2626549 RepID=UPI00023ECC7F|nr:MULTISPECIES: hypothetical protein [unclassified Actinoplanes]AEV83763.1 hypothetical protein ACPL_2868 [Actinoplanes sp. SE50/110]ATO82093.1 hypothetical protein ACWT_2678 [Actinoplanes sp. SE50]SLL99500.1 hypothetical protein ACSP50_2731 [Actinoplanes sp. SE50/110]
MSMDPADHPPTEPDHCVPLLTDRSLASPLPIGAADDPATGAAADAATSAAADAATGAAADAATGAAEDAATSAAGDPEPTGEWPLPGPDDFAEDDTDPHGFIPVSGAPYPPATDPFDDPAFTSAYPLPGWSAPPDPEPLPSALRQRRPMLLAIGAFVALAGLIGAFLLVRHDASGTRATVSEATAPTGMAAGPATEATGGTGPREVAGPRDGLAAASFEILDSATLVRVSAADLGADLFRVGTAAGSGLTPAVERSDGTVRLRLRSDGSGGSAAVTVQLSSAVRWTLRLDGGTAQTSLDLTGADLAALDLGGGASRIDLTLPAPHGLLPVRMSGGVDQFRVVLSRATPVRVRVQSGAGQITLGGATHRGIAPGRSFTTADWSGSTGVDLLAVAGLATLTVTG